MFASIAPSISTPTTRTTPSTKKNGKNARCCAWCFLAPESFLSSSSSSFKEEKKKKKRGVVGFRDDVDVRKKASSRVVLAKSSDTEKHDDDSSYSNNRAIDALRSKAENPWSVNVYHSKRKEHKTNELGDIVSEEANDGSNILEQPGWDADGKLRFSIMIMSEELGLTEKQVEDRVGQLFTLIPGLKTKVGIMKTADLVRISASIPDVYKSLVALKDVFPGADLPTMITNRPSILLEDAKEMERKVKQLREACPKLNWDAILSDHAYIFEIKNPGANCLALKEKLGTTVKDFEMYIARNPMSLLSVQTGEELLEYDNGSLRQLKANLEGTPKAEGW
jgi:hypothetical protein